jgi:hypothetical protein
MTEKASSKPIPEPPQEDDPKAVSRRNFIKGVITSGVVASSAGYLFRSSRTTLARDRSTYRLRSPAGSILKMVLTQGVLLAGVGVCAGLIMAAVTAPMIATLLYGVRALDVNVFLTVPLILFVVSFTASYVPARRAARVNPIVALREG